MDLMDGGAQCTAGCKRMAEYVYLKSWDMSMRAEETWHDQEVSRI